jgi:hypothetical protein
MNGNVGIGTTSPTKPLDVHGDVMITGTTSSHNETRYPLNIVTYSTSNTEVEEGIGTGIQFNVERRDPNDITSTGWIRSYGGANIPGHQDSWNMGFKVRDNDILRESLTLNYNGFVGIGTTNPINKLHLHEDSSSYNTDLKITHSTTGTASTDGFSLVLERNSNRTYIIQREYSDMFFRTNNTDRFVIDKDGNFAIRGTDTTSYQSGTTTYADNVKIYGNTSINSGILFIRGGIEATSLNYESIWGSSITGGNDYRNWTNKNEGYMYIDSGGDASDMLFCGHYSGGGGSNSYGYAWHAKGKSGSLVFQTTHPSNSSKLCIGVGTRPGSYTFYVSGSAGGSSSWSSSDDRIKHNEEPITNALETIRKLKPKHYFKTDKIYAADHNFQLDASGNPIGEPIYDASGNQTGTETHDLSGNPTYYVEDGLIAQEVFEIPELRFCFRQGELGDDSEKPHGVNYTSIFVRSVKALQELDEIVQAEKEKTVALETKVKSLETENATLKTQMADVLARLSNLESG